MRADLRQAGVERRIETGRLRHVGKMLAGVGDDGERRRRVQGGEGRRGFDVGEDCGVDQAMAALSRPAMHDAMADRHRGRHGGVAEQLADAGDRFSLAGNGDRLRDQVTAVAAARAKAPVRQADRVRFARQQQLQGRRRDIVHREFQRRRAAVQRKDRRSRLGCAHAQALQRQSRTSGMSSPCSLI